jgi:hypothetical protein
VSVDYSSYPVPVFCDPVKEPVDSVKEAVPGVDTVAMIILSGKSIRSD